MGLKRGYPQPKNLAAKLFAIRQSLGLSQTNLARHLNFPGHYNRISEFETGRRVPSVLVLLAYARAANVPLENVIDDNLSLF
jgi:transcriptional regulator with XRE-family HTH domain